MTDRSTAGTAESVAYYDPGTNRGMDSRGVRYWKVKRPIHRCELLLGEFRCEREEGHRGFHRHGDYRWRTPRTARNDGTGAAS